MKTLANSIGELWNTSIRPCDLSVLSPLIVPKRNPKSKLHNLNPFASFATAETRNAWWMRTRLDRGAKSESAT